MISHFRLFLVAFVILSLSFRATSCQALLPIIEYGGYIFYLNQGMECRGGKVYEIQGVQDMDQCSSACLQYRCVAVNVFNTELGFVCEILGTFTALVPAQGAACYTLVY